MKCLILCRRIPGVTRLPHKADKSFFVEKRPWSKKKDIILGYYLDPYLAKVAKLHRPILLVDGFAGAGKYGDGETGSPVLMAQRAKVAIDRDPTKGTKVLVRAIESDKETFQRLQANLSEYQFAKTVNENFADHLPKLEPLAKTHTLFIYVDPFAIDGIEWGPLDHVIRHVGKECSVELLINFNAKAFVRRALSLLARDVPPPDPKTEEIPDFEDESTASMEKLNAAIGGDWWKEALASTDGFAAQVYAITERYCSLLRTRFDEVGSFAVKSKAHLTVPNYFLIFGSRSPDALVIMNDAMAKARGISLIETELFSKLELEKLILELSSKPISRGHLILSVMRRKFCMFEHKEIRGEIEAMLKAGKLISATGSVRINDDAKVWRAPFEQGSLYE